jgi:aspartyl protease family protein
MIREAVTLSIGVLALAALSPALIVDLIPAGGGSAPVTPAADVAVSERQPETRTSGYREASLAADSRGQYAAHALVDGLPVRMLVDTGASVVAISAATAARLGLVPAPGPKWRLRTANGESVASPVVLESVSFGGLYLRDVQALILAPEAGDVNLLGASFLKRLVSVEQRDGILFLKQ